MPATKTTPPVRRKPVVTLENITEQTVIDALFAFVCHRIEKHLQEAQHGTDAKNQEVNQQGETLPVLHKSAVNAGAVPTLLSRRPRQGQQRRGKLERAD